MSSELHVIFYSPKIRMKNQSWFQLSHNVNPGLEKPWIKKLLGCLRDTI